MVGGLDGTTQIEHGHVTPKKIVPLLKMYEFVLTSLAYARFTSMSVMGFQKNKYMECCPFSRRHEPGFRYHEPVFRGHQVFLS